MAKKPEWEPIQTSGETHEEMHDILHSVGALGTQVKASEKQKANENKAKGYAKAKTIGKKYG